MQTVVSHSKFHIKVNVHYKVLKIIYCNCFLCVYSYKAQNGNYHSTHIVSTLHMHTKHIVLHTSQNAIKYMNIQ